MLNNFRTGAEVAWIIWKTMRQTLLESLQPAHLPFSFCSSFAQKHGREAVVSRMKFARHVRPHAQSLVEVPDELRSGECRRSVTDGASANDYGHSADSTLRQVNRLAAAGQAVTLLMLFISDNSSAQDKKGLA